MGSLMVIVRVWRVLVKIAGTAAWGACLFAGGLVAMIACVIGIIYLTVTSVI